MVSYLRQLNCSHFTHMQEQISHTLSLLQTANPRAAKHHPFPLMSEENLVDDYERESQRSLLGLQIKSIPSVSRNLLYDESH